MDINISIVGNSANISTLGTNISTEKISELYQPIRGYIKRNYGSAPSLHVSHRKQRKTDPDLGITKGTAILNAELLLDNSTPNKYMILTAAASQLQDSMLTIA